MKAILLLAILAAAAACAAQPVNVGGGGGATFYPTVGGALTTVKPTLNGLLLDWCFDYGSNCGFAAADWFCKSKWPGSVGAQSYNWETNWPLGGATCPYQTAIVTGNKRCQSTSTFCCGAYGQVTCRRVSPDAAPMLNLVNQQRAKVGAKPLCLNSKLTVAAQLHNDEIYRTGVGSHDGRDGSKPYQRAQRQGYQSTFVGENWVYYSTGKYTDAFNWWMNSPGHKANMLNTAYTHMGLGRAGNFWVMVLGASSGDTCDVPSASLTVTATASRAATLSSAPRAINLRADRNGTAEVISAAELPPFPQPPANEPAGPL